MVEIKWLKHYSEENAAAKKERHFGPYWLGDVLAWCVCVRIYI